jgi:hypothetical protein
MKRYLCFSIIIAGAAFLPSAAMASGALANTAVSQAAGGNVQALSLVAQWEQRLARLQAQQAAGVQFYGNSTIPIASAIAKTQRQLAVFRAAAGAGNPLPPVAGGTGTATGEQIWPTSPTTQGDGGGNSQPGSNVAAAGSSSEGQPSSNPDTGAPSAKPDV